jgi:hypothetical protein
MPDEISSDRVLANGRAARVPLKPEDAARIARAVRPVVARLAAAEIELPLEIEPASFLMVQRREILP